MGKQAEARLRKQLETLYAERAKARDERFESLMAAFTSMTAGPVVIVTATGAALQGFVKMAEHFQGADPFGNPGPVELTVTMAIQPIN